MTNTVIDSKTQSKTFGLWPAKETVTTTLNLLELSAENPPSFGISYDVSYSGIKDGHIVGGPINVQGNGTYVVNENPRVVVTISNYSLSGNLISFHIVINVTAPVIGDITIFDGTLGGPYGSGGLIRIVEHIAGISQQS